MHDVSNNNVFVVNLFNDFERQKAKFTSYEFANYSPDLEDLAVAIQSVIPYEKDPDHFIALNVGQDTIFIKPKTDIIRLRESYRSFLKARAEKEKYSNSIVYIPDFICDKDKFKEDKLIEDNIIKDIGIIRSFKEFKERNIFIAAFARSGFFSPGNIDNETESLRLNIRYSRKRNDKICGYGS